MRLTAVPLATALLPITALHACYLIAAEQGHVAWCVPYLPDCVSISASVRHAPEQALFRAALIPGAVLMILYWRLNAAWLGELGAADPRLVRAMTWFGVIGALGLFLYAGLLGEAGDLSRRLRRIGMIGLYLGTYLAQFLLTIQMRRAATPVSSLRSLAAVTGLIATLAVVALASWAFYDDYRRYDDAFEWGLTLLLLVHTFISYFAWRESGFRARFSVGHGCRLRPGITWRRMFR